MKIYWKSDPADFLTIIFEIIIIVIF